MKNTKNMLVKLGVTLGVIAMASSLASPALAALTLGALTITSDGVMTITTTGADSTVTVGTGRLVLSPTFSGASSRQSVEADGTLSLFTGGYGAAVMGNIGGTVGAGNSIVAGLIGKYNVATNPSDHPAAGVVGEVGELSAGTADGAFIAVLGGDSGELDAGAAYGVRYLNSTAGSQFGYGLDLYSAAVDSYLAVTYATADIRLQNGETIANATDGGVILASSTGSIIGGNSNSSNPLLKISADTLDVANGVRQGVLSLDLNRPSTNALTSWDGNGDIAFRIQATNRAVSGASGGTRGMELSARNRASGTESWISGAKFTAENSTDGGTIASSVVGEFYMKNNSVVSTSHYGVLIQDDSQGVTVPTNYAALKISTSAYDSVTRANAIWIDSLATSGFTSGVRFDGPITNVLTFADADGTNGADTNAGVDQYAITGSTTADGLIQVDIGGTAYYIPVFDAGSVTNE